MSVVELGGVSRWYGSVLGLSRVDLSLGPGVTALLGPNGAGKSTLLRLVAGLIRPSLGHLTVWGEPPFANPRVAARMGVVPEENGLTIRATVIDWLRWMLRLHGFPENESLRRAAETLAAVGLESVVNQRIATLSRGMRQRLKLAQAIAHRPELLVLDEPLAGLDPVGRREVTDWIRDWGERGVTVLVSSHILHEVELMTREVVLMSQGRVLASGNVHDIRRLIDAHPHRILVSTRDPRRLAARLIELPGVQSVSFSEEREEVELMTAEPERFYGLLADLVLQEGLAIRELTSTDDNLEAVFDYLVAR